MNEKIYMGIDPQPSEIDVHIRNSKGETLYWCQHYLEVKSSFSRAQDWQEYIWRQCNLLFETCLSKVKRIDVCGFEQQRGRINSMIEQSLLGCCMIKNIKRVILHPLTWKKLVGLKPQGSNAKNKKHVTMLLANELVKHNPHWKDLTRVHDLCDAWFISKATHIIDSKQV